MARSAGASSARGLPSVDRLLRDPVVVEATTGYRRPFVVNAARSVLNDARRAVLAGETFDPAVLVPRLLRRIEEGWSQGPVEVINATGVVLHTNLGRAPLSQAALAAMASAAAYSDLEFDRRSGGRGSRQAHVATALADLLGAEAGYVTVNAASAVLLALAAHARGRQVIVSRGQAVEIGGGFRIPVILRQSGARLVEVGTTNRTRLDDYAEAITARTAAILHVHTANFRIEGFTESVPIARLADLSREHGLLLLDDNGSGALLDTADYGLAHEPTPQESLDAGADMVVFSGDKLLGGPQSGLLVGKAALVDPVAKHPLARALRPDKTILAALSATLAAYLRGDAVAEIPLWAALAASPGHLQARAETFAARAAEQGLSISTGPGESVVGGGSLPGETLPTTLLHLPREVRAAALRAGRPAVVARAAHERVLLDLRTVPPEQEPALLSALLAARPARSST